ncbi:hypothetical protein Tco_1506826 [Tanacetum coccineum]
MEIKLLFFGASSYGLVLACRMQLSSAERKLPVIVLHWLPNSKSQNDYDGQLFVYEGDLVVLTLEWSARMKTLRCVGRAELTLSGSFSDMRLLLSTRNNHGADLLVAVLDMDAFSVSFVYNGDHVKSPKGARPKDLDKPVNKLMFVCTKDATLVKTLSAGEASTAACCPKGTDL